MKIGIVGLGNFGRMTAGLLAKDEKLEIVGCDIGDADAPDGVRKTDFAEVAKADVVILCVPLATYDKVLADLQLLLNPETLVVDICSVKVESEKRVRAALPEHQNLLITHPMFGPETAKNGTEGLTLVVTAAEGERAKKAIKYCQGKFDLKIMRMTSEEHDRQMADVHALTFFVARGLKDFGVAASAFDPPSFQWLLKLVSLDKQHSEDLFRTMEVGNPFAKSARERFVKTLQEINQQLEGEKI